MEQLLNEVLKEPLRFLLLYSFVERQDGVHGPLANLNISLFNFWRYFAFPSFYASSSRLLHKAKQIVSLWFFFEL